MEKAKGRKAQILEFLLRHFARSRRGRCLQGCGNRVEAGKNFCSDVCRHLYDIREWGRGRIRTDSGSLARNMRASVVLAKKGGR